MKVILLQDVKKVGKKNDTLEVSDGYAKNFLFPRKLAVQVTAKSKEILENQKEQAKQEEAKAVADAQTLAKTLENITVEFACKVGADGKMFGSISLKQIEEEMDKIHHIKIDKRKFIDKDNINSLGYYKLKIELHKGVVGIVNVHVKEAN